MSYSINYIEKGFILYFSGVISLEEIYEAVGKLSGHEFYEQQRYQLWNYLDATFDNNYDLGGIEETAAVHWASSRMTHRIKAASVINNDALLGLYKQYIETSNDLGTKWEYRLFDSHNIALKWCKSE